MKKNIFEEFGSWKPISDITFHDIIKYPVWVWCLQVDAEGVPDGGDETAMRPILNSVEVPIDHVAPPLVLLKIQGTEYYASGLYNNDTKKIESISVYVNNDIVDPNEIDNLSKPVTYIAIPRINGVENKEFLSQLTNIDEAICSNTQPNAGWGMYLTSQRRPVGYCRWPHPQA